MHTATAQSHGKPKLYNPRHPERSLLYETIAEHFETWLDMASAGQFDGQGDRHTPKPYVRQAFRRYLECGIFVHGFARARCDDCGHDYFVAFSCKGRGVCPSCNTRRMVETAAHLTDHCPGAQTADMATLHIGAVAFIHRFGSSLNAHVHFHVCVVDGVFEATESGVIFHPASGIDADTVAQVQATLRRRILRAFVGRGLLESFEAKEMLAYKHSGFSVDADVCIEAHDRAGLERLLRYCARPPFSMERLRKAGSELVYRCAKQHSEPGSDKRGAKVDELHLTPLELIDRIAALVPPPRTHRHRYFGVLAPNSPLRAAVTAMAAAPAQPTTAQAEPTTTSGGADGPAPMGSPIAPTPELAPPKRAAHYLWAVLIARIYEVFPLLCPICGGQMRIIAFITHSADIRQILEHVGANSEPPRIAPARGPPLWEDCDAWAGEGSQIGQDWDLAAQPAPDYEVDQRANW